MTTFLTDLMKKGYAQDEIFAVISESERERKRRRMQAIVIETVAAHRLKKMKELLTFENLATWRRINGFDRIVDGEENWFDGHRSLPPTPEQYTASLRLELKKLKHAISVPAEDTVTRPWQKTINFVDGLKGKLPDEEIAVIKRYVEKRSREAAQAQVTVTPVDTAQHSSPCPLDPEPSSSTYVNLENTEGDGSGAGGARITISWYGSQNVRTAVSPERGDMGATTNHRQRLLDRGRGFKPRGKNSVIPGTIDKHENFCRHLFDSCYPRKPQAQDT